MARPRPIAVVRFRANTETSVNSLTTSSTRNVPTTDSAPMASGSDGGDDAAEDQQQQDQRDRDGDQLGPHEVGLDRLVDLGEHRAEPADARR